MSLSGMRLGSHLCLAYGTDASFDDVVTRFTLDGFARAERVVCFLPAGSLDRIVGHLERTVAGFEAALANEALQISTAEDAYLPDGRFDPDARIDGCARMAEDAIDDGFTGLRVLGEVSTITEGGAAWPRWPGYELRVDLLTSRLPLIGVCAFDTRRCDPTVLEIVQALHGSTAGTWEREPICRVGATPTGGVQLAGEVDVACASIVESSTRGASGDVREAVIDLSELRFVDVAGMRAITAGVRALSDAHPRVQLHRAPPMFTRLWNLLECERLVDAEVTFA